MSCYTLEQLIFLKIRNKTKKTKQNKTNKKQNNNKLQIYKKYKPNANFCNFFLLLDAS